MRSKVKQLVDSEYFQRGILFAILVNTLSMGIEYHNQVQWLIELWFYVPLDTKQVISETFPQASLLAWYGKKLNPTQQKHASANEKMSYNTKSIQK